MDKKDSKTKALHAKAKEPVAATPQKEVPKVIAATPAKETPVKTAAKPDDEDNRKSKLVTVDKKIDYD
jgi:hypothetical protein